MPFITWAAKLFTDFMKQPPFPNDLEADYQKHLEPEKLRTAPWTGVLGTILFMAHGILKNWILPFAFQRMWFIGIVALLLIFTVVLLLRYHEAVFLKHYNFIVGFEYLFAGLAMEAMIYLTHLTDATWSIYYAGLLLICMAIYSWTSLPSKVTVSIGVLLLALYIAIVTRFQFASSSNGAFTLAADCFLLVGINIIGITSQQIRIQFSRKNYLLQRSLQSQLEMAHIERQQSEFLAKHDLLTGLPNRRYLLQHVNDMIKTANEKNESVAIFYLDLDGFKPINDTYGHQIGDMVLQIFSKRLKSLVRHSDMVGRLGGDEFVIALVMPAKDLENVANKLSQKIILALSEPITIRDIRVHVFASIGTSFYPYDGITAGALLSTADERMYRAKRMAKTGQSYLLPSQFERSPFIMEREY